MRCAGIQGTLVVGLYEFDSLITAKEFLDNGALLGIEAVIEISSDYGIGDSYIGGEFKSNKRENNIVFEDPLIKLQNETAALTNQLAQSDDAALSLFEAQAATDEAIIAIYEKIGGTTA